MKMVKYRKGRTDASKSAGPNSHIFCKKIYIFTVFIICKYAVIKQFAKKVFHLNDRPAIPHTMIITIKAKSGKIITGGGTGCNIKVVLSDIDEKSV